MSGERKALVVGINQYEDVPSLKVAVADAEAVALRLRRNGDADETANYSVKLVLGKDQPVTRAGLRGEIRALFADFRGDLLFFFAGHGVLEPTGGYLVTSDGAPDDWGVAMQEVIDLGLGSDARSITILLDCCHSGDLGNPALLGGSRNRGGLPISVIRENMTVIAAALPTQVSLEQGDHGLFTAALLDALDGAAADLLGEVTTSSLYAHVERRFSPWQQRPVTKAHITAPTVVRRCAPKLSVTKLRRLTELFPVARHQYPMDPEHDPAVDSGGRSTQPQVPEKMEVGALFKRYRDAGLVRATVPGEDLYWTAQRRHTAELTLVGREYWALVKSGDL
jgi:hypothetical protein